MFFKKKIDNEYVQILYDIMSDADQWKFDICGQNIYKDVILCDIVHIPS